MIIPWYRVMVTILVARLNTIRFGHIKLEFCNQSLSSWWDKIRDYQMPYPDLVLQCPSNYSKSLDMSLHPMNTLLILQSTPFPKQYTSSSTHLLNPLIHPRSSDSDYINLTSPCGLQLLSFLSNPPLSALVLAFLWYLSSYIVIISYNRVLYQYNYQQHIIIEEHIIWHH